MRPLLIVFLLCLALLLWAAWSIARAVRRHAAAEAQAAMQTARQREPEDQ